MPRPLSAHSGVPVVQRSEPWPALKDRWCRGSGPAILFQQGQEAQRAGRRSILWKRNTNSSRGRVLLSTQETPISVLLFLRYHWLCNCAQYGIPIKMSIAVRYKQGRNVRKKTVNFPLILSFKGNLHQHIIPVFHFFIYARYNGFFKYREMRSYTLYC